MTIMSGYPDLSPATGRWGQVRQPIGYGFDC